VFKHDFDDKVTDIQFNPSHLMTHQFASGSENGCAFVIKCSINFFFNIEYSF
jgi:hypothetical protein